MISLTKSINDTFDYNDGTPGYKMKVYDTPDHSMNVYGTSCYRMKVYDTPGYMMKRCDTPGYRIKVYMIHPTTEA